MQRHVIFSPARSRDMFPNSAFSLLLDPALKWSRAIDEKERVEYLEEIRMGFTKLIYCIESANHLLHIDDFY